MQTATKTSKCLLLLCIVASVQSIGCHFECDTAPMECDFVAATPKCQLNPGCPSTRCGFTAGTRVNESTLDQTCPEIETIAEMHGECTGCDVLCEAPTGNWVCDIKIAPVCQPVCENPGTVCTGEMIRSYEPKPTSTRPAVMFGWVTGACALVLALLLAQSRTRNR